jgi:hypothetical protein
MNAAPVTYKPQQSFQHTLREIAVNREDPCEVVRELISNAYDAAAENILVMPYLERRGLVFFDDGIGLSASPDDIKNGVVPYTAFFSIGKTTKPKGQAIGYKCQGSKLCFASNRVTVVTKTAADAAWKLKVVDNPKQNLNENYDLTPEEIKEPWKTLTDRIFTDPDNRTTQLIAHLDQRFFETNKKGTLIIIEEFDTQDYERYFSIEPGTQSYLYHYIRLFTAHGDVRYITEQAGFSNTDINAVKSNVKTKPAKLSLMRNTSDAKSQLIEVPYGYPFLSVEKRDLAAVSPNEAGRLRDGRFCARYATTISHGGQTFSLIVAIDGKRRALDGYPDLGRQSQRGCGIPLSTQRGTFLSAQGIKISQYNELFDEDALADFNVLRDNSEHHMFVIDGPFELVTNRNSPAPAALKILKDPGFVDKIKAFLVDVISHRPRGNILKELVSRLAQERTHHREEQYLTMMKIVKEKLPSRSKFSIEGPTELKNKWFFEPQGGEENFVGALFTLFSHLVPSSSPLKKYWHRPLSFAAFGIDSISCSNEDKLADSLEYLEYKHTFSPDVEFNHPFR